MLSLLRSSETQRQGSCPACGQCGSTPHFEDSGWFAGQREPSREPQRQCALGLVLNPQLRANVLVRALLQVWVIESSMEVMARQLLLLYLALMPQDIMGNDGAWDFCECFNLHIRV